MNGKVIPNTPIAVDVWSLVKTPNARLFFCSHAHSDHMVGLTKSWSEKLYCSDITAKVIRHKINVREQFIHTLSLNEPHIIALDSEGEESMTVTLIDANHCPGAVMFLFEGYFGRVLYTGDFRYHPCMFDENTVLGHLQNVDDLYLDNTYCHPNCVFPSQEQAKEDFLDIICRNFDRRIVIASNELGKEDLFEELALTTKTFIQVTPEKLAILRLLNLKDVFTTDPSEVRIRLVSRKVSKDIAALELDAEDPALVVIPTALMRGINGQQYENTTNIHVIPYSEHSSYSEIMEFVKRVKPKRLFPIVMYGRGIFGQDCTERTDFTAFEKYLDVKPRMDFVVPESVQEFMNRPSVRMRKPRVVIQKLNVVRRRQSLVKKGVEYKTPDQTPEKNDDCEPEDETMTNGHVEMDTQDAAGEELDQERSTKKQRVKVYEFKSESGADKAIVEVYMNSESSQSQSVKMEDESQLVVPMEDDSSLNLSSETIISPDEQQETVIENTGSGDSRSGVRTRSNHAKIRRQQQTKRSDAKIRRQQQTKRSVAVNADPNKGKSMVAPDDGKMACGDAPARSKNSSSFQNGEQPDSPLECCEQLDELSNAVLSTSPAATNRAENKKPTTSIERETHESGCRCELLSPAGLIDLLNILVRPTTIEDVHEELMRERLMLEKNAPDEVTE